MNLFNFNYQLRVDEGEIFMMSKVAKLLTFVALIGAFSSCRVIYEPYQPRSVYNCYPVYDYWGYYLYDECYWEYYNDNGSVSKELDIVSEVADKEEFVLERTALGFSQKYNLSTEQGLKIAKNIRDYNALKDRSAVDISDFAQKLYGINPAKIVSALSSAQVGEKAQLEAVIEEASENFKTSKENMKSIIKDLHGRVLSDHGIEL